MNFNLRNVIKSMNMDDEVRERLINIIDRAALFFFIVLIFFLPISNAAVESSFGFILLCFILRSILKRPTLQDIKTFFRNRINLSLLIFYIIIGLSFLLRSVRLVDVPSFITFLFLSFLLISILKRPTLRGIKTLSRIRINPYLLILCIIVGLSFFARPFYLSRSTPLFAKLILKNSKKSNLRTQII